MTVRVNKDAFNIREKLSELEGLANAGASKVIASATKNTGMTLNTVSTPVQFPVTTIDTHGKFSNTNSRFTVPVAGDYFVMFNVNILSNTNVTNVRMQVDGAAVTGYTISNTNHTRMNFTMSGILDGLGVGQYIEIGAFVNTGTVAMDNAGRLMIYKL
tara:strand:+ start:375 stop:848 length:474 start_codon:yes stop_codon:yes gene_type:complete